MFAMFVTVVREKPEIKYPVCDISDNMLYCSAANQQFSGDVSKVDGFSIKNDRQPIKSKPPFSSVNKSHQSDQAG